MKTEEELTQYIKELAVIEYGRTAKLNHEIRIASETVRLISHNIFRHKGHYKFFDWMRARGYLMANYDRVSAEWAFVKDFSFKVPTPPPNSSEYLPTTIKMKTFYCASCGLRLWSNEEVYFYKCKCGREDII